jgi:hypothetical protein
MNRWNENEDPVRPGEPVWGQGGGGLHTPIEFPNIQTFTNLKNSGGGIIFIVSVSYSEASELRFFGLFFDVVLAGLF